MKKTKKRLLLVFASLLVCNVMLLAQVKRIVTGDVKDSKGQPLSSATITIKCSIYIEQYLQHLKILLNMLQTVQC